MSAVEHAGIELDKAIEVHRVTQTRATLCAQGEALRLLVVALVSL